MPTWKYLALSLFSNQPIIDGRKRPWYWAVIFFVLSVILMVIPVLSTGYTDDGTTIITPSNDNGVTLGLYQLAKDDDFAKLYLYEDSDGEIELGGDGLSLTATDFYAKTEIDTATDDYTTQIKYYTNSPDYTSDDVSDDNEVVLLNVFSTGETNTSIVSTTLTSLIDSMTTTRSFILFTPTQFYLYTYPFTVTSDDDTSTSSSSSSTSTTTSSQSFVGTFDNFKEEIEANGSYNLAANLEASEYSTSTDKSENEVYQKWGAFITTSYLSERNNAIWIEFGIISGCTAGIIILAGLSIWLVTLGRRNLLHNNCTPWQGLKMGATLSFTCAVIGMAVSFYSISYGILFGIMAIILRTMWLTMKTTASSTGSGSKPLYQARE